MTSIEFDFVANKNAESGERTNTIIPVGDLSEEQTKAIASALVGLNNLTSNRRKGYPRTFTVEVTDAGNIRIVGTTTCTRSADAPVKRTKAVNPFLE